VQSTEQTVKRAGLRDRFVLRIRAFAESLQMTALQSALPISFAGLVVGLVFFMATQPEATLLLRFSNSFTAAFGIMSTMLVIVLMLELSKRRAIAPLVPTVIAFAAFAVSLPYDRASSLSTLMKALGTSGLFLAIGIALITDEVYALARRRLGDAWGAVAAGVLTIGTATVLMLLHVSLTRGLDAAIAPVGTLGDSLTALLVIVFLETLLWTIGIHGPALLAPVVLPVYVNLQLQNTAALAHGDPLPHIVTVSLFLFVFPGGAGATLPLVLLLLRSKVKRIRTIALATVLPAFANINEPLMFGMPLVLNPVLGIPFVIVPLVLATVSWWTMHLGFVARPAIYIPSPVPIPIGAFLATKDWRSVILMLVNVGIGAAIYAPFVAVYERNELARTAPATSAA